MIGGGVRAAHALALLARVLAFLRDFAFGEESSDEVEGEASEKLDFFKTYSSRTELQEDMATLARESRPANSGTARESNLLILPRRI